MKTATKILIIILLVVYVLMLSCRTQGKLYAVRSVEFVNGRTYRVVTDSFARLVMVKGMGKYKPDSITKKK